MLGVWTALLLYAGSPGESSEFSQAQAGLRYADPQYVGPPIAPHSSPRPMAARRIARSDGEVQMRLDGFRMQTRATLEPQGQLVIHCAMAGHPATAHSHAAEQSP
jgi:hypothetical protein